MEIASSKMQKNNSPLASDTTPKPVAGWLREKKLKVDAETQRPVFIFKHNPQVNSGALVYNKLSSRSVCILAVIDFVHVLTSACTACKAHVLVDVDGEARMKS